MHSMNKTLNSSKLLIYVAWQYPAMWEKFIYVVPKYLNVLLIEIEEDTN